MDRTTLVGGNGESHFFNHSPQNLLLDGDGILVLHLREIRVIGGTESQNIEIRVTAGEVDHLLIVGSESYHIIRHPPDNIAEQPGVQHDISSLGDIGGNTGTDTGLHIITGDGQLPVRMEQQSLQRGDGALLGHGTACHGDSVLQKDFFTAEFHHNVTLPLYVGSSRKTAFQKEKKNLFRKK